MGMHSGSGGHENTVKTHKNGELNFHLKGGSRQGPTKHSWAIPAEGSHRGSRLAQGGIAKSEDWTRCLYIWSSGSYGLFNAIKVFCWCIYINGHNEQALNIGE